MALRLVYGEKITPDKVAPQSLGDILGEDDADFKVTQELVQAALFSQIAARRAWASRALTKLWAGACTVASLDEEDTTYAYIRFPAVDRYILVGRYSGPLPVETPSDLERSLWDKS